MRMAILISRLPRSRLLSIGCKGMKSNFLQITLCSSACSSALGRKTSGPARYNLYLLTTSSFPFIFPEAYSLIHEYIGRLTQLLCSLQAMILYDLRVACIIKNHSTLGGDNGEDEEVTDKDGRTQERK